MTTPPAGLPPEAIAAAAIDPAEAALHAYLGPWLSAEVHGTPLRTQIRTAAILALEAAAPHLAAAEREWCAQLAERADAVYLEFCDQKPYCTHGDHMRPFAGLLRQEGGGT